MRAEGRSRKSREAAGRRAETVASIWLRMKGYRILARRMKSPVGEIDLLVRRGSSLVAVEVKVRPGLADGLAAVPPAQWRRIARAADWYISGHPDLAQFDWRFDLVVVCGIRPHHIEDAWRP